MADVSNRDEADKCKQIARSALAAGDSEKAIRFLQKAKRMCPGDTTIDGLIKQAESGGGGGGSSSGGPTSSEGMRQRTAHSASASSARPAAGAGGTRAGKDGNYTAEQMQLVQRILRTKDYYAILEVDKSASEDTVKRAYKKLALKLHPDKNKAPGAEEAFKKLSKAMQCLSDEDKKDMYNRYRMDMTSGLNMVRLLQPPSQACSGGGVGRSSLALVAVPSTKQPQLARRITSKSASGPAAALAAATQSKAKPSGCQTLADQRKFKSAQREHSQRSVSMHKDGSRVETKDAVRSRTLIGRDMASGGVIGEKVTSHKRESVKRLADGRSVVVQSVTVRKTTILPSRGGSIVDLT